MALKRKTSKQRQEPRFEGPAFLGDLRLRAEDRPTPMAQATRKTPKSAKATKPSADEDDDMPARASRERKGSRRGNGAGNSGSSGGSHGGGRKGGRGIFFRLAYWGSVLGLWAIIAAVGAIVWISAQLPAIQNLEIPKRPPTIFINASDGSPLTQRGEMAGTNVPLAELPPYLPQAFIAIEDRRFYSHFGVDPAGIARALVANVLRRGVSQGGSTLTQQLAKNLFLTQERTFKRKLQEAELALWLEHKYSKATILELYLNRVYFGAGAYGVEAAAQRYFGKSARQVSLAEAATLAGLVKSPSRLAPNRNPDGAQKRAELVLAAMADMKFISDKQEKVALAKPAEAVRPAGAGSINYVADWIMEVLDDLVGRPEQDIIVETSIDARLQSIAEAAVIDELAAKSVKFQVTQGALVAMTPDGAVRALVGGRNYAESQFNRVTAARRQPGSAFKPFVYLTAIERGLAPDTVRQDAPINIKGWRPENYTHEYYGNVTLAQALSMSLNTVAVRLALEVGPQAVMRTAYRMGISSKLEPNASLALGTSEVSLMELTGAYAPFANGGTKIAPHVVARVRTPDGKVLFERQSTTLGRVIDARSVSMMNQMMTETLLSGTARKAEIPGWSAAGKTGTTQDFRDAWFIGYTGHLVTGVWLGNDDNSPTRKTTGGGLPVEVWTRFMRAAHGGVAVAGLPGLNEPVAGDAGGGNAGLGGALGGLFRGGTNPPIANSDAPTPPASVGDARERTATRGAANNQDGGGLDGWLLDKLFRR